MSFLVTATDTDAGKTYVSCLLLEALRAEGKSVVGYKPLCCGERNDVAHLKHSCGDPNIDEDLMNPVWLKSPVAPLVASMVENTPIDTDALVEGYKTLAARYDHVIVEGVGGWAVPITRDYHFGHFAKELGLPIILVVNNKLGALNHTLLTLESIKNLGLECAGIVFNTQHDEQDLATITNQGIIEDLTGVPCLTDVIPNQDSIEAWPFLELLGE